MDFKALEGQFNDRFGSKGQLFFAPGRVNLLGEHVDYNGGKVLPMAIERGTYLWAGRRDDDRFVLASENFERTYDLDCRGTAPEGWGVYPWAVVQACREAGLSSCGVNFFFAGDLPAGAGLSSSASVEAAVLTALKELNRWELSCDRVAQLAHRAENRFVGVNCGIMDQYAVVLGRQGHALSLDCRSATYEHWPLPEGFEVVVTDSGVRRKLTESRYNQRREECEQALYQLQKTFNLVDLCGATVEQAESLKDATLRRRARHCAAESERMRQAELALKAGDASAFGELMTRCHRSLAEDFEVSHPALDCLVDAATAFEGCLGARLTGAGFGGCTVALLRPGYFEGFDRALKAAALRSGWPEPRSFVTLPAAGACTWRCHG